MKCTDMICRQMVCLPFWSIRNNAKKYVYLCQRIMESVKAMITGIVQGNFRYLARTLTLVENGLPAAQELLESMEIGQTIPVIGITGPPGAGKSTLINALINHLVGQNKRVAVLAVDPTSPFNFGSLLGDRIRMAQQFNNPNVYIRSIATRGALGGVSVKTMEMVDVLKASNFDLIIIETVGVGQSEVEIAGLADQTLVVLVPEAGDEIQHIKSGLMEIAQAFVVNKADREGALAFANNLKKLLRGQHQQIPVFQTVADKNEGIARLADWALDAKPAENSRRSLLMTEKAYQLIQHYRMNDVDKKMLLQKVEAAFLKPGFNIYQFAADWMKYS